MLSCLKGRVCLFQGLLLLGFVGCSSAFQGGETNQGEIPISNAQVAEKVSFQSVPFVHIVLN